jgi:hypothetical protein
VRASNLTIRCFSPVPYGVSHKQAPSLSSRRRPRRREFPLGSLISLGILWWRLYRQEAKIFAIACLGAFILNTGLKVFFTKPRPLLWGNALVTLQKLYETNNLPPSIIITPDGNDLRGKSRYLDPQYIDGANGKISTAIGDELVKVIQSRYRTLPTPNFWAIAANVANSLFLNSFYPNLTAVFVKDSFD